MDRGVATEPAAPGEDGSEPGRSGTERHGVLETLKLLEQRVQVAALHALDLEPRNREEVVHDMLFRHRRDTVGYWLQLVISMAIATLGLVLGSTAVVIGAMLISPLMGPIVKLGMGLVVGSPAMTLNALGRTVGSVAVVVGGAALLVLLLPFHEVNSEIASRTSPTVLDLLVAVAVALAAAFTTVRSTSDTASAAAGTAIGISLVPPLGVIGFGIGVADWSIAWGATLLFITNYTSIVLVAVLSFLVLGFENVKTAEWERSELQEERLSWTARRVLSLLRSAFGSRYSRVIRIVVPLMMLAAIVVPLSRALNQVTWEVRARSAVDRILSDVVGGDAVRSEVAVARGAIRLRLYLLGSPEDALAAEQQLKMRLAAETGTVPTVSVMAVPDAQTLRQITSAREPVAEVTPGFDLRGTNVGLESMVRSIWPADQLGPLYRWALQPQDSSRTRLSLHYLGLQGGSAVEALLGRTLSERLAEPVSISLYALPSDTVSVPAGSGLVWLPTFLETAAEVQRSEGLHACVWIPEQAQPGRNGPLGQIAGTVLAQARQAPAGRMSVRVEGNQWRVLASLRPCVAPAPVAPVSQAPTP